MRFLRNLAKGEDGRSARSRRRLMERELKKLYGNNDGAGGNKLDGVSADGDKSKDVSNGDD